MVSRETSGPVPALPDWLQARSSVLGHYAELLATAGVDRGLIGPREVPRLWERHLLNCAVVVEPAAGIIPQDALVGDVGSGAGLPGLVWAIARPDLRVVLIEPLLRRSTFLDEAVESLGLRDRVTVWRGRGEEAPGTISPLDVVTARAVAPLDRLLGWTVPLVRPGGRLALLKGSSAQDEITQAAATARTLDVRDLHVLQVGAGVVDPPTTVVTGQRGAAE